MTTDTGPWIVRLGKVRGEGWYVTPMAAVRMSWSADLRTSRHQREARRFKGRFLAELYAAGFGGRVVRLKERVK